MIINLVLIVALFSIPRDRLNGYAVAGILGLIKALLYTFFGGGPVVGVIMGVIFFGLGACFVHFLERAEKRTSPEELAPGKSKFKWEHIIVAVSAVLMMFGEFAFALLFRQ